MENKNEKINKFIHFGCWNDLTSDGNLRNTMINLKTVVEEFKPDFIEIAGDNYYTFKKKDEGNKIKQINKSALEAGFDLLKNAVGNTPVFNILGNHDLETNFGKEQKLIVVNDEKEESRIEYGTCEILQEELRIASVPPSINLSMNNFAIVNNFPLDIRLVAFSYFWTC